MTKADRDEYEAAHDMDLVKRLMPKTFDKRPQWKKAR